MNTKNSYSLYVPDVNEPTFELLLVEDNTFDAHLLQDRLKDCDGPAKRCNVRWLSDCDHVIQFLRADDSYTPDLIIVDYRMPSNGGRAIADIKNNADYKHIPVVALTGSHFANDVCDIYRRGANCCYHKPSNLDEYDALIRTITVHWFETVCSPRRTHSSRKKDSGL